MEYLNYIKLNVNPNFLLKFLFAIIYPAKACSFDYFLLLGSSFCVITPLLFVVRGTIQSEESSACTLKKKDMLRSNLIDSLFSGD